MVAPWLWIRSHQIWKRKGFASPHILAEGWMLCRRTRKKRVPSTKGFMLQTWKSRGGQGWLYQAVRDITVQEAGQSSEPARAHLPWMYVSVYDYKAQFSILHSLPKIMGLWHMTSDHILEKCILKGAASSQHVS